VIGRSLFDVLENKELQLSFSLVVIFRIANLSNSTS